MASWHRSLVLPLAGALLVVLGGCVTKYYDANTGGGNKAGAHTVQLDVLSTYNGCTQTVAANGPTTVSCEYSGPGSLATTSVFALRDVPTGTPLNAGSGGVLLQVPVSATGFNGTYSGPVSGALKFTTLTAPLAADVTQSIVAEAGTKLLLIDPPGALGLFRFIVNFMESGAAPSPLPLKVLFVGKLTVSGHDYYPPVLPCTSDFAAIPALLLPTLNFYAPIDMTPVATQKGCTNASYSFASSAVDVIEFYNAALDHYFITWGTPEIAALDAGTVIKGWVRTGHHFKAYNTLQPGTENICRFYIPPGLGDSHFFGRGDAECASTRIKFPALIEEDPRYMQMPLPAAGVCPANTMPIYRVFSNRADANHRYMTDRAVRNLMVASGWLAEGDGPDLVVMCSSV